MQIYEKINTALIQSGLFIKQKKSKFCTLCHTKCTICRALSYLKPLLLPYDLKESNQEKSYYKQRLRKKSPFKCCCFISRS